jgi:hypothetical protein
MYPVNAEIICRYNNIRFQITVSRWAKSGTHLYNTFVTYIHRLLTKRPAPNQKSRALRISDWMS